MTPWLDVTFSNGRNKINDFELKFIANQCILTMQQLSVLSIKVIIIVLLMWPSVNVIHFLSTSFTCAIYASSRGGFLLPDL